MKGDQMGILAAYPTQRELPLSNQTRFNSSDRATLPLWCGLAWSHPMIIRNNFSHQRAPGARNQADEQSARVARVLLADDHPILLDGLRALLRPEPGVEVVATAPDGASALELIRAHEPHMAVLDINMPKLTGLDVLESLEQDGLATRVIFLTGTATDEQIAAAVKRGA